MAKNKKSKSLLNEATVRRMMKLADIPELSDRFLSEESSDKWGHGGPEDEETGRHEFRRHRDEEGEETKSGENKYGDYKDYMDVTGQKKGDKSKTHPGHPDFMQEDEHEEEELHATEDELGAEDDVADEEADELGAEASEGEAEITPEAAQAIVDLAAQLEASGALADAGAGEEVEAEVEMTDDGDEVEAEVEDLEEALAKLGIDVVDDAAINEAVRKRVVARLLKEKRANQREKTLNTLTDRIFARLRTTSKK